MELQLAIKLEGFGLWGAGKETFEADIVTSKIKIGGRPIPIIPSPYLKGLLRGWAYRLAPLLNQSGIIASRVNVFCTAQSTCNDCIVCRVFGASASLVSPLRVSDFYPTVTQAMDLKGGNNSMSPLILPHIRIDDLSGRASEGALFFSEAVSIGTSFKGTIQLLEGLLEIAQTDPIEAARLLLSSVSQLNYGYAGRRTRVRVSVINAQLGSAEKDQFCKDLLEGLR